MARAGEGIAMELRHGTRVPAGSWASYLGGSKAMFLLPCFTLLGISRGMDYRPRRPSIICSRSKEQESRQREEGTQRHPTLPAFPDNGAIAVAHLSVTHPEPHLTWRKPMSQEGLLLHHSPHTDANSSLSANCLQGINLKDPELDEFASISNS